MGKYTIVTRLMFSLFDTPAASFVLVVKFDMDLRTS